MTTELQGEVEADAQNFHGTGTGEHESLQRRVGSALCASGYPQLRHVTIRVAEHGRVRLEGAVPRYYIKQVAQTAVLGVEGVAALENRLRVC